MAACYQQNPRVEVAPMKNDAVLFNPDNNKFCVLNRTAAFLWIRLAKARTVEELAGELCANFDGVSLSTAVRDVEQVVEQFLQVECIKGPEQTN